jgi:signal transduction histidine kinase/CheY-like chemotaxis protein
MWSIFKVSGLTRQLEDVAKSLDFSRRLDTDVGGQLGEMARHLNVIFAEAEQRDRELRQKLEELTDARDDAQTANQLMRRLKNELKTRSAERDAALSRAEAANQAKSQFLANMSHEIRTPLHGILGIADVLSRTNLEGRQQALVQTMLRSGKGLLTIINDVLDFSKIESGRFDLIMSPFSLHTAVEDLVGLLTPRFEAKGIELVVRIDDKLPDMLFGDVGRIKQVLTNLLENGLKFTAQGYVLLEISGAVRGEMADLTIVVQDTGIGIAPAQLDSVFETFNQGDNSSTRPHEGTGLGLAISRMLINKMTGRITLASTLGHGTTVTIAVPMAVQVADRNSFVVNKAVVARAGAVDVPSAASALPALNDGNIVSLSGGKFRRADVLLVEDNIVNQEVATEYLRAMGCLVTIAQDGHDGLNRFKAGSYDLVFMDGLMPVMDGLQATRMIREVERNGSGKRTPIVALTANAFPKDRENCLVAGMDDVLSKPFNYDELNVMLKKWLPFQQDAAKSAG